MAEPRVIDRNGWGTTEVQKPLSPSKVETFVKDQRDSAANTRVGKVEEKAGDFLKKKIEEGQSGNFFTRNATNVALGVMSGIQKVIQPITQGISTTLLTPQAMATQGLNPVESFKFAKDKAKQISMGQAGATLAGPLVGAVLPENITPTFAKDSFDVFNDKQRNQAFKNEWVGIFASGTTDFAIAATGSKATGIAMRQAKNAVLGPSEIKSAEDLAAFSNRVEEAVAWGTNKQGAAPNGTAVYVDDLVKQTNVAKIADNPLVLNSQNPQRTATILSRLDNHRDVGDFLLAQRGDAAAYDRFFKSNALMADHIDDFGLSNIKPTTNFSDLSIAVLDKKYGPRYQAIIDAKKTTDKRFAEAVDMWNSNVTKGGVGIETYVPGKYAPYESLQLAKNKVRSQARSGELKIFGADGNSAWKSKLYQTSSYERGIRFISFLGDGTPQGYINISNPRKYESANDLRSDLNRIKGFNNAAGIAFKNRAVEKFLSESTDTGRARVLGDIEKDAMLQLAKIYGVKTIGSLDSDKAVLNQISEWHMGTAKRRQTTQDYLATNKIVPSEDGTLNLVDAGIRSQATEAAVIPMLDFGRLEAQIILNTKRLSKGAAPISAGQTAGALGFYTGMTIGAILDTANMVFSNLNLLRFAYIPKNSMVDPYMRASMALETIAGVNDVMPGMKNIVYNASLRAEKASRWMPGTPGSKQRRLEKDTMKRINILVKKDLNTTLPLLRESEVALKDSAAKLTRADAAFKRAEVNANKATKNNKAAAEAKMHQAEYDFYKAQEVFNKSQDAFDVNTANVRAIANTIESERNVIKAAVIARGDESMLKRIGQDSDVLTVDGVDYNIQGLADPSVRGVLPFLAEVDTAQSYLATAMQTQMSKRVMARGSQRVMINKNTGGKSYYNAMAHVANREIRQELDLPLGMIFRGDSDAQIMNWLKSGNAGKEYTYRISEQLRFEGRGVTDEDLINWINHTRNHLNDMYPDPEVRRLILERPVTVDEMEKLFVGNPNLLEDISGPNIDLHNLNWYEFPALGLGTAVNIGWKILSDAETKLVRTPLFLTYTREEMTSLVQASRRAGFDPTDAVVNHEMRQVAYRRALDRVEQTLYSARRLTNGMYLARFAMSFPLAFFNSQAVALRLMAKNPMNAYWYNSIANAFDNFEAYEDEDGNTYKKMSDVPAGKSVKVTLPLALGNKLPESVKIFGEEVLRPKDALKAFTDPRGGGLKWNPKQMEFMIADPSISWFGGVAVSDIIKNGIFQSKTWGVYGEDIEKNLRQTLGDDFFENSILYGGYPAEGSNKGNRLQDIMATAKNAIVPSYLQSLLSATGFNPDRFIDDSYQNWRVSMSEWDRNGRVGNMPTMDNSVKAAGNLAFIKAFVQFNFPISTGFDPVTRSATQYYGDLLTMYNGDNDKATKRMIEEWGVDALALIGSSNKNIAGFASTEKDIKVLRNNTELLKKIAPSGTKYAEMLSSGYGDISSDYNVAIAAIYKRMKYPGSIDQISTKKTQEELQDQVISKMGYAQIDKANNWRTSMMMQYGITSTSQTAYEEVGIKARYDEMVADIYQTLPGFAKIRNGERKDFWTMTYPAMREMANDLKWREYADSTGNTKWEEIAYWLEQAGKFRKEVTKPNASREYVADKKAMFDQFHYNYLQTASDEFFAFSSRWLSNMPELEEGLLVTP